MKTEYVVVAVVLFVMIGWLAMKYCPVFQKYDPSLRGRENYTLFRDPLFLSYDNINEEEDETTGKLGYGFYSGWNIQNSVL